MTLNAMELVKAFDQAQEYDLSIWATNQTI